MKSYIFEVELHREEDGRWSAWVEAPQQRCLASPCAPACRRAAGRASGRGRHVGVRKGRLNFLSAGHICMYGERT